MALVNCFECGKQISSLAASCPQCGAPASNTPTAPLSGESQLAAATAKTLEIQRLQTRLADHKTNHILHLLLSVFMVGLWVIPWIFIADHNASKRRKIQKQIEAL